MIYICLVLNVRKTMVTTINKIIILKYKFLKIFFFLCFFYCAILIHKKHILEVELIQFKAFPQLTR